MALAVMTEMRVISIGMKIRICVVGSIPTPLSALIDCESIRKLFLCEYGGGGLLTIGGSHI